MPGTSKNATFVTVSYEHWRKLRLVAHNSKPDTLWLLVEEGGASLTRAQAQQLGYDLLDFAATGTLKGEKPDATEEPV